MGRRLQREGTFVCLRLTHVYVWQKPARYCKAIILQLKINKIKNVNIKKKHLLKTVYTTARLTVCGSTFCGFCIYAYGSHAACGCSSLDTWAVKELLGGQGLERGRLSAAPAAPSARAPPRPADAGGLQHQPSASCPLKQGQSSFLPQRAVGSARPSTAGAWPV